MKKVLVVGQAVQPTGYARMLEAICQQLCEQFEVHHLGINYSGEVLHGKWTVHPNNDPFDPFADLALQELLTSLQPDAILMMHDLWIYPVYREFFAEDCTYPVLLYAPIEGRNVREDFIHALQGLDHLVLFCPFATEEVRMVSDTLHTADPTIRLPLLHEIPHGVETAIFRPIAHNTAGDILFEQIKESRILAKKKLWSKMFANERELEESFIVLNANRNMPRKRLDLTLQGFAKFAQGKPSNVRLVLHAGLQEGGYDLQEIAGSLDIEDRVTFTAIDSDHPYLTNEDFNILYNATDVGVNTSAGEGFGLIAFEHGATGAAQIVPNHSSCADLWKGSALLLPTTESYRDVPGVFEQEIIDAKSLAVHLESLYADRAMLVRYSLAAVANATQARYRWNEIGEQWRTLIETCIAQKAASLQEREASQLSA